MDAKTQTENCLARLFAWDRRHLYCYLYEVSHKSPQQSTRLSSICIKYCINIYKPTQMTKQDARYLISI